MASPPSSPSGGDDQDAMDIDVPVELPEPIIMDKEGDLFLIVGKELDQPKVFRVHSHSMSRASCVFKAMLYGPFVESKGRQGTEDWKVELPEDDPVAFEILLRIIHSKFATDMFNNNAKRPSKEVAVGICQLADKYVMIDLLIPFGKVWLEHPKQFNGERTKGCFIKLQEVQQRLILSSVVGDTFAFWKAVGFYAMRSGYKEKVISIHPTPPMRWLVRAESEGTDEMLFEELDDEHAVSLAELVKDEEDEEEEEEEAHPLWMELESVQVQNIIGNTDKSPPAEIVQTMRLGLIDLVIQWMNGVVVSLSQPVLDPHCGINYYHNDQILKHVKEIWETEGIWPIPTRDEWIGSFALLHGKVEGSLKRLTLRPNPADGRWGVCRTYLHLPPLPSGRWEFYDWNEMKAFLYRDFEKTEEVLGQHAKNMGTEYPMKPPTVGPCRIPSDFLVENGVQYRITTEDGKQVREVA